MKTNSLLLSFSLLSSLALGAACTGLAPSATETCQDAQATFDACGIETNLDCDSSENSSHLDYSQISESSCEELGNSEKSDEGSFYPRQFWNPLGFSLRDQAEIDNANSRLDWLYGYYSNSIPTHWVEPVKNVQSGQTLNEIIKQVPAGSCEAQVVNSGRLSTVSLDPDPSKVCRHHAKSHSQVLTQMGYRNRTIYTQGKEAGHALLEVTCPNGQIIMADAYNNIFSTIR